MVKTMIRPTSDRIVVKRIPAEEATPGGIFLPTEARNTQPRGTVVAAGPGRLLEDGSRAEMEVKEGDVVVYNAYHVTEVNFGDERHVVMRESEVLFVE